eukprot:7436004-Prorocentrum_lima.AAC.1
MTSSLVGSEMCIRDRHKHIGKGVPRGHTRNMTPLDPAARATPTPGQNTVSYTHLTLPTICSV